MASSEREDCKLDQQLESSESASEESSESNENDNVESNYCTLLSMFPNVKASYIREICSNPPFRVSEEQSLLVMLINHLLGYEDNSKKSSNNVAASEQLAFQLLEEEQEQINETTSSDQTLSEMLQMQDLENMEQEKQEQEALNDQLLAEFLHEDKEALDNKLKILVSILPDANPDTLRQFLEENHDNGRSLEEFVEFNLLNKNYEKRDKYFTKKKSKEKIEKYITNFKVEDFIEEFPEPFDYFENVGRNTPYQAEALNFLKNRYNNYNAQFVTNVYASNKHNLSITDKNLQIQLKFKPPSQLNIEIDNVPLLQEIAFIHNKDTIKDHLEVIIKKEEKEMQLLKAQKLLLECKCCFDDIKPQDCIECEKYHIFCKKCVIKGSSIAVSDGAGSVRCFADCNKEIPLNILRRILPQTNFDALLKKRQELEIAEANLNNLVNCPFCTYSEEIDPQIKTFSCKNPECMKISCRLCRKLYHLPVKCEDVIDEHKGRLYIEEELSKTLIRTCYKCCKPFIKDYGCNKMTCACGAMMCYICRKPITGYEHFDGAGQCQTHQNSQVFDQEQIQITRIQATTTLLRDFPDLKLPDV